MIRIPAWQRLVVVGLALVLGLTAVIAREKIATDQGREVRLKVTGIDPRELLTGHAVALQFVEPLPSGTACPLGLPKAWSKHAGWLALESAEDRWVVAQQTRSRLEALTIAPVAVRGQAICEQIEGAASIMLDIGIDRFHASQSEAERLEQKLRSGDGVAIISVGEDGRARLKGLLFGKQRLNLKWW